MTDPTPGSTVNYRVTFLEMTARPDYDYPAKPGNIAASLLKAESPPAWYLRALYDAVGRDYGWQELHERPGPELDAWLADKAVAMWTLMRAGWPQGFYVLDARAETEAEISLFGLVPQAMGMGLGGFLLRTAILTAWDDPRLQRLRVSTSSLDHPRALAAYQRHGFEVVSQELRSRELPARPQRTV